MKQKLCALHYLSGLQVPVMVFMGAPVKLAELCRSVKIQRVVRALVDSLPVS